MTSSKIVPFVLDNTGHLAEHDILALDFNVTRFGAVGNGTADDTAAIQAAIDAACGSGAAASTVRNALGPVVLPTGNYRTTAPLVVRSVIGFEMYGQGLAQILADASMTSALELNGTAYSSFHDFTIRGSGVVDNAIYVFWDSATSARSSTINTFRNIVIRNLDFVAGVRIGLPGAGNQCDNTSWYNITITGPWTEGETSRGQFGFFVGDGVSANNLVHNVYKATLGGVRYGVQVSSSEFSIDGVGVDRVEQAFRVSAAGRFCSFRNIRCEDTNRLLHIEGGTSAPSIVSVSDVNYVANQATQDGFVVFCAAAGSLRLQQIHVRALVASDTPRIRLTAPAPLRCAVEGLVIGGTFVPSSVADVFSGVNATNTATARGVAITDAAGIVTSVGDL